MAQIDHRENKCQNGRMKMEEANGAVSRRLALPGTTEMMEESKKTGKKETIQKSRTMEKGRTRVRMDGEPLK